MEQQSATLRAMSDAVLAIAAEATVEPVLQRLAHAARELVGAAYAALGVPDGEGGFAQLHHLGDERRADRGAWGRCRARTGCSARCSSRPSPYRTSDIRQRPALPRLVAARAPARCARSSACRSSRASGVIGAFYLTDKDGRRRRSPTTDQELIELLAAHAAIAIDERAPVRAQPRAVDRRGAQPARARAARRGHARSCSASCSTAEAAAHAARPRPRRRRARSSTRLQRARARGAGGAALAGLRAAPAATRARGPAPARCASTSRCCARVHGADDRARASTATPRPARRRDGEVLRIAQEALQQRAAPRRAPSASTVRAARATTAGCVLEVADDGVGFDPDAPGAALAPARADLDGGARAARSAARSTIALGAGRRARRCGWRSRG